MIIIKIVFPEEDLVGAERLFESKFIDHLKPLSNKELDMMVASVFIFYVIKGRTAIMLVV